MGTGYSTALFIRPGVCYIDEVGEVPERSNGTAWNAVTFTGPVGSNPTLSAFFSYRLWRYEKNTERVWDSKGSERPRGGMKRVSLARRGIPPSPQCFLRMKLWLEQQPRPKTDLYLESVKLFHLYW